MSTANDNSGGTAIRVTQEYFASSARLYGPKGLGAAIRGLAIDHARIRVNSNIITDFTGGTGGTVYPNAVLEDPILPTEVFDASTSGGAPVTALNAAFGAFENASATMMFALNVARTKLGLPVYRTIAGTLTGGIPGRIPPITTALTAASGDSAVDYQSGRTAMTVAKENFRILAHGFNEVFVAVDYGTLDLSKLRGEYSGRTLADVPTVTGAVASTDPVIAAGANSIDNTVVVAFLGVLANNIDTITDHWDTVMDQVNLPHLTGNDEGVVGLEIGGSRNSLAVVEVTKAFTGIVTSDADKAPVAGLNTEIGKIENNFADIARRVNILCSRYDRPMLVTPTQWVRGDTALEDIDDTLTAVADATSGTSPAASETTIEASFLAIANNLATIADRVNDVALHTNIARLVGSDGTGNPTAGGTVDPDRELSEVPDVAPHEASVSGASRTLVANSATDAALDLVTDAMATIVARLNVISGTENNTTERPLSVVAG